MVDPVSGGIQGKGKATYRISVDVVIELEEDAKAGVCKDGMRRFRENMIE
jgi:hypothetical protein